MAQDHPDRAEGNPRPEAPVEDLPTKGGPAPTEGEIREALQAVLASRTFERASRLRDFLRFVCDLALRGEGTRINESLIAIEVFGRGDDYSPGEDSIVRRQARALREKLQSYYEDEGAGDGLRIHLPVGRYVPSFSREQPSPPGTAAANPRTPRGGVAPPEGRRRIAISAAAVAVSLLFVFGGGLAAGVLLGRRSPVPPARPAVAPALTALWGPWLDPDTETTVCLSNLPVASVKIDPEPDPDSPRFRQALAVPSGSPDEDRLRSDLLLPKSLVAQLHLQPDRKTHGHLGAAAAAVRLAAFLARAGVAVEATSSRLLAWETLRRGNVIILGNSVLNHWVGLLLRDAPLRVGSPADPSGIGIFETGGRLSYDNRRREGPGGTDQYHALISMLPATSEHRRVLLLTGLRDAATEGAADLLLDPARAADLLGKLRTAGGGASSTARFQAVVLVTVKDKQPILASVLEVRAF